MPRSHPSVRRDTAEDRSIQFRRVSQREEHDAVYEQFAELKYKYRNRAFWCKGYYVDTVGKNEQRIAEYIKHQLDEDRLGEQLSIPEADKVRQRKK